MKPAVRVLLVDDFSPFRDLLRSTLQNFPDLEVIGEAADGLEAVQKYQELRPDMVFLDLGLPKMNGIEVTRKISSLSPNAKILIVSDNRSREITEETFRSGARGYLAKHDIVEELRNAVASVLAGVRFVSASVESFVSA